MSKMRTNYEPFEQLPSEDYNKNLAILQTYVQEVVKANDRLIEKVNETLPLMIKHHGHMRQSLKVALTMIAKELHMSNGTRIAAVDGCFATTMAEIERLRHQYHGEQRLAKQHANKEKQEYNSLVIDEANNTYYYMEQVEVKQPNGQITLKPVRRNISREHPWVANMLLAARARR
jgi:hypothetical protein